MRSSNDNPIIPNIGVRLADFDDIEKFFLNEIFHLDYPTDKYKSIKTGHVNTSGLTELGKIVIKEMMKLGMMIDVDHMSEHHPRQRVSRRCRR